MLDFSDLTQGELLVLGRRASELCAHRFDELIQAADPADAPLRALLRKMSLESMAQASFIEPFEHLIPEDSRLPSRPEESVQLIESVLTSISKSLGEGPLGRDIALFLSECLEEESSRLYRMLAGHSRESRVIQLFTEMAEKEKVNMHYLREVVLEE